MIARLLTGTLVAGLFAVLATANAGGYRYGVSDQAFYLPVIAKQIDPSLFPRDAALLAPQTRLWLGDDILGAVLPAGHVDMRWPAAALFVAGLLLLAGAGAYFLRGLGASSAATIAALAILTMRHRITRTGVNSLEGYTHPRMIAFALGLWALGLVLRRRFVLAVCVTLASALIHPTTAFWFALATIVAAAWQHHRRAFWITAIFLGAMATAALMLLWSPRMDAAWLAPLAEKDYLFPAAWPLHAWLINLAYVPVLWLLHLRRNSRGVVAPGERALCVALSILAIGFLAFVPLTMANVAIAVQLQIPRVFWLADVVALLLLAWWLVDDVAARWRGRWPQVVAAVLIALATARGVYVITTGTQRPLVQWTLPAGDWTDALTWLRTQPVDANVLADPGHAIRYGTNIRIGAERDTVLEQVKDSAMAMYDRAVAIRVGERIQALSGFEEFDEARLRSVAGRFAATLLLVEKPRPLPFPVMYENASFVIYSLR